jgi:hypothetical protein
VSFWRDLALTVALALAAAALISSVHANRRIDGCRAHPWGASSVTATKIHGRWVVSKPTTTGCR